MYKKHNIRRKIWFIGRFRFWNQVSLPSDKNRHESRCCICINWKLQRRNAGKSSPNTNKRTVLEILKIEVKINLKNVIQPIRILIN